MSDDLISRSALLEDFRNTIMENSDTFDWLNMIARQPTAYDADKVIEQLEDLKRRCWLTIANTGNEKLDYAYENVGNALDRAIEIVKSGGVAND